MYKQNFNVALMAPSVMLERCSGMSASLTNTKTRNNGKVVCLPAGDNTNKEPYAAVHETWRAVAAASTRGVW
jgi:hypothetical protein